MHRPAIILLSMLSVLYCVLGTPIQVSSVQEGAISQHHPRDDTAAKIIDLESEARKHPWHIYPPRDNNAQDEVESEARHHPWHIYPPRSEKTQDEVDSEARHYPWHIYPLRDENESADHHRD